MPAVVVLVTLEAKTLTRYCMQVQNIGSALWFIVCLRFPLTGNVATGTTGSYAQIYAQIALLTFGLACFAVLDFVSTRSKRATTGARA